MQAFENFFDQRMIFRHEQMGFEDTGVLDTDRLRHPLADVIDLSPGGEQSILKAKHFARNLIVGQCPLHALSLPGRQEKRHAGHRAGRGGFAAQLDGRRSRSLGHAGSQGNNAARVAGPLVPPLYMVGTA